MRTPVITLQHKSVGFQTQSSFLSLLVLLFLPNLSLWSPRTWPWGSKGSLATGLTFPIHPSSQMGRFPLNRRPKVLCRKKYRQMLDKGPLLGERSCNDQRVRDKASWLCRHLPNRPEAHSLYLVGNDQQNLGKNTAQVSSKCQQPISLWEVKLLELISQY